MAIIDYLGRQHTQRHTKQPTSTKLIITLNIKLVYVTVWLVSTCVIFTLNLFTFTFHWPLVIIRHIGIQENRDTNLAIPVQKMTDKCRPTGWSHVAEFIKRRTFVRVFRGHTRKQTQCKSSLKAPLRPLYTIDLTSIWSTCIDLVTPHRRSSRFKSAMFGTTFQPFGSIFATGC